LLLVRCPGRCISRCDLARRTDRSGDFGQPEVENLGVPALGDENICWLDIAMNDASRVGGVECIGDFDGEGEQSVISACRSRLLTASAGALTMRL
jgi:hypothetical protein